MHRRAVQDHRQPELAELQDLRGQLERGVKIRVPPGQADVARRGQAHRLGARLAAVPDHPGHRGRADLAERGSHPAPVAGVPRVVVDLVADHVHLGGHPALRQQRRQPGHLQRVPPRRELPRVHEPQRFFRGGLGGASPRMCQRFFRGGLGGSSPRMCQRFFRGGLGGSSPRMFERRAGSRDGPFRIPLEVFRRKNRREQHRLAAGGGHAALEEAAQFLRLAEQVPGGLGDHREVVGRLRRQGGDRLRDVGEIGPQPAVERAGLRGRRDQRPAAQHHEVVTALGVDGGQHADRLRDGQVGVGHAGHQPFGVRAADRHRVEVAQRGDQPVRADRRFQHDRHRAPGGDQRLRHRLQPDRRAVEEVHVHVAVDERARSGCSGGVWGGRPPGELGSGCSGGVWGGRPPGELVSG